LAFIETRGLTKQYGHNVFALNRASFTVQKGEWVAVTGPSGSGKSTLLNILGCLDTPTEGQIFFEGRDLAQFSAAERARFRAEKVGFIFQQYHLVPYLTALENVMLAQYFHSLADEAEAADVLRSVGLGDRLQHLPRELSGGEQQRVCIARSLVNQPDMILADEPTGNLDEVNETIVMSLIADLHRQGRTVILVTHDPDVARMAERRMELHHGRLTEVSAFAHHREEDLRDDLLHAIWKAQEISGDRAVSTEALPDFAASRATFNLMAAGGWIDLEGGSLGLTPKGEEQARLVIRRHRLSERLFFDTFGMPLDLLDSSADKVEHTLSPQVVEKLCIFLKHPQTCPHGSPIPRAACCERRL
jgi:putative ABC transport system ATP-binding protein